MKSETNYRNYLKHIPLVPTVYRHLCRTEVGMKMIDYHEFGSFARNIEAKPGLRNVVILGPIRSGKSQFCNYLAETTSYTWVNVDGVTYPAVLRRKMSAVSNDLRQLRRKVAIAVSFVRRVQTFHRSGLLFETGYLIPGALHNNRDDRNLISEESYLPFLSSIIRKLSRTGLLVVIGVPAERDLSERVRQLMIDRAKGVCWTLRHLSDEEIVAVARSSLAVVDILHGICSERGWPLMEIDASNHAVTRDSFLSITSPEPPSTLSCRNTGGNW